ncbi:MAG: DNA primase family protein [Gemmataceae bacterium]
MTAVVTDYQPSSFSQTAPMDWARFVGALFDPHDYVLVRPVETWTESDGRKQSHACYPLTRWQPAGLLAQKESWRSFQQIAEENRAKLFFGVCPRGGQDGQFDLSWQIRTVRALWADLDLCTVPEAMERCESAALPRPSVVVGSGNGVHLYWLLAEPFLIDDASPPPAVLTKWVDRGPDQKRMARKYIPGEDGQPIYLYLPGGKIRNPDCPWGELSPKARHVQDVLAGLAAKIGGDHTKDLARCLRLPGTLNRKDEHNGRQPVPCALVECDATRRYPFAQFDALALASPQRERREKVAAILLPTPAKLKSQKKRARFQALVNACNVANVGQRSELDFALFCWAVENGVEREELWQSVQHIGKCAERGREYFDLTLASAEEHVRQKIYAQTQAQIQAQSTSDGTGSPDPSPAESDGPDVVVEEGDGSSRAQASLPESVTDPHRLAQQWLRQCARHERPGDCAAYFRQSFLLWKDRRWNAIPDHEMRADLNRFIRHLLEDEIRSLPKDQANSENKKAVVIPAVTTKLVADVLAAIQSLVLVPQTVEQPSWRGADHPGRRNWIALRNGLLDLDAILAGSTPVLRPHTPLWFSTTCLPYDFDPAAGCPRWRAFLERNLGDDPGKQRLLQQWMGYLLPHDTSLQRFLVLVGEGANGKSVVCEVIHALLGEENVSTEPLEMFGDRFRLAGTLGKLANITAEVGELDKVAEGVLKAFVVGDPMSFEVKYKSAFTARPTARLILATNNVPHFSDKSDGLWRRMLLLPFTVQIPEAERNPALTKREYWIASGEMPGILNWALSGLVDLRHQEGKFSVPQSCQEAVDKVRVENNPARRFLLEGYREGNDGVFKATLYQDYARWCEQSGHHKLADIGFGREVRRTFPGVRDGKMARPSCSAVRENAWLGLEPRPRNS